MSAPWPAEEPLDLPEAGTLLRDATESQYASVLEDKERWKIAKDKLKSLESKEIRRWLESLHPVYRQDIAWRLNWITGKSHVWRPEITPEDKAA